MAEADDYEADDAAQPVDPKDPKSSKGWLSLIEQAQKVFQTWQDKSDGIDKLYANLERLAGTTRDREFQLFWANIQVLGPSIYSRPPVPVVTPRFRDGKPLPRIASELVERSVVVSFDTQDVDYVMRMVRDDLNICARGAVWVRYEAANKDGYLTQAACLEHVDRRDFLHDPVRNWKEVDWVAKRSWLTKREMRKRFRKTSGDKYQDAGFEKRKDETTNESDGKLKAAVWEVWSQSQNKVVWVSEGVDVLLDEQAPHLTLEGFFPCPRPAYGTLQRGSLVPIPDVLLYKDQLEEINQLTGRIHALADALRLKGFYPAGSGDVADAIEKAIKSVDDKAIVIPVNNWAIFGNGSPKDAIIWLPLADVANAVTALVALRKELITDVYQIMGLSDIMRGSTEASETLGAQQLKSQYGSVRIKDKKDELVRIARDLTRISGEIMSENFSADTLLAMSQMDIPSDADVAKQAKALQQQIKTITSDIEDAAKDPEVQQAAKQNPKAAQVAQKVLGQAQQQAKGLEAQIKKLGATVTIEKVMKFLRDNRTRCFTLDIETDSTIAPDENEQKQRMVEYATAMGGLFREALPMVKEVPQAAPLFGQVIKKMNSTFRVGREFEQVVEDFVAQMGQMAKAPQKGPTPEQMKQQADAQKAQIAAKQGEMDAKLAGAELQLKQQQAASDAAMADKDRELEKYKADLQAATSIDVAQISAKQANDAQALEGQLEKEILGAEQAHELSMAQQEQAHQLNTQQVDQAHQAGMQQNQQAAAEGMAQAEQAHQSDMAANQQAADAAMQPPPGAGA